MSLPDIILRIEPSVNEVTGKSHAALIGFIYGIGLARRFRFKIADVPFDWDNFDKFDRTSVIMYFLKIIVENHYGGTLKRGGLQDGNNP
jgi:hypothetical protein